MKKKINWSKVKKQEVNIVKCLHEALDPLMGQTEEETIKNWDKALTEHGWKKYEKKELKY